MNEMLLLSIQKDLKEFFLQKLFLSCFRELSVQRNIFMQLYKCRAIQTMMKEGSNATIILCGTFPSVCLCFCTAFYH